MAELVKFQTSHLGILGIIEAGTDDNDKVLMIKLYISGVGYINLDRKEAQKLKLDLIRMLKPKKHGKNT